MAFSSLPLYHLDPPNSNSWNQHNQQTTILHINEPPAHLISPPPISSQPPSSSAEGAGGGSKPGSMTERARLAKIPLPESALKCPRCDSTNTKFCYFNNYSLSQPRHFCKTCRRYWTRGGALRNVPVGGGCRRNNKRGSSNKQSSSKNSSSAAAAAASSSCSTATSGSTVIPSNYSPMNPNHLSFLSSLADQYSAGLNFTSLQPISTGDYGGGSSIGLMDQWRIQQSQQLPFLGGNYGNFDGGDKVASSTALGLISQLESVKMEESHHQPLMQTAGLSLPRQYLGMAPAGADVYLGGGGWAEDHLSGFNSSSSPRNISYQH